jgi:hypothetical protein
MVIQTRSFKKDSGFTSPFKKDGETSETPIDLAGKVGRIEFALKENEMRVILNAKAPFSIRIHSGNVYDRSFEQATTYTVMKDEFERHLKSTGFFKVL